VKDGKANRSSITSPESEPLCIATHGPKRAVNADPVAALRTVSFVQKNLNSVA
jgi:hypothetical protein